MIELELQRKDQCVMVIMQNFLTFLIPPAMRERASFLLIFLKDGVDLGTGGLFY